MAANDIVIRKIIIKIAFTIGFESFVFITTELAKGKSLEQAKKISNKDVAEALGELPKIKMHCSNLAADALRNAIENYESNC